MRRIPFYFDFVSPYSYLALTQAEVFAEEHEVEWELRPVVYSALLDAHGLVGPAEREVKRRYTFADVLRCAQRLGVPLVGPPVHPFRSIESLRVVCLFRDEPRVALLAAELAWAAWGDGHDLGDWAVLAGVVRRLGFDAADLPGRCSAPEIKARLRRTTEEAVAAGVFGVPTFELDRELFWGHDRMDQLAARLEGKLPPTSELLRELVGRPRGPLRREQPRA